MLNRVQHDVVVGEMNPDPEVIGGKKHLFLIQLLNLAFV